MQQEFRVDIAAEADTVQAGWIPQSASWRWSLGRNGVRVVVSLVVAVTTLAVSGCGTAPLPESLAQTTQEFRLQVADKGDDRDGYLLSPTCLADFEALLAEQAKKRTDAEVDALRSSAATIHELAGEVTSYEAAVGDFCAAGAFNPATVGSATQASQRNEAASRLMEQNRSLVERIDAVAGEMRIALAPHLTGPGALDKFEEAIRLATAETRRLQFLKTDREVLGAGSRFLECLGANWGSWTMETPIGAKNAVRLIRQGGNNTTFVWASSDGVTARLNRFVSALGAKTSAQTEFIGKLKCAGGGTPTLGRSWCPSLEAMYDEPGATWMTR